MLCLSVWYRKRGACFDFLNRFPTTSLEFIFRPKFSAYVNIMWWRRTLTVNPTNNPFYYWCHSLCWQFILSSLTHNILISIPLCLLSLTVMNNYSNVNEFMKQKPSDFCWMWNEMQKSPVIVIHFQCSAYNICVSKLYGNKIEMLSINLSNESSSSLRLIYMDITRELHYKTCSCLRNRHHILSFSANQFTIQ